MAAEQFKHPVILTLRDLALSYPEVAEGDSCVKRGFKARKKGFLYLGENAEGYNVMLKLDESIGAAEEFAGSFEGRHDVGKGGWVTLRFPDDVSPPEGLLERWIEESFRMQAPKTLVATLDG